ncbi:hypothetical protein NBRC10512_000088 [Rhodotorula toruloides]|uniref:RHTO0S09e05776g2_1 n=2 Tax=Rhodotorula toruloides TaxID=5286 RepID=A0A061BC80_RHOTO|nr:uncharacterized protein RHTO_03997 [Rhodotorula toruloides NP11]EMS19953.1 hypothetical protein RHTO_03997 [Rhodotorula toruloides NP11]CDR44536.1 RHTO0S09e05776g2_1 [Rhodotorula toruloides]
MPPKNEPTPIVEPIQGQGTKPSPGQQPIHPSPVVDEGPSDSTIPPNQRSSDTQRPGTQDALRGQGNSATNTNFSREDYAPALSEQQKQDSEYKKAEMQHRLGRPGGKDDFRQTGAKSGQGEPTPGKPHADPNTKGSLIEAGTTMAGAGGADSGIEKQAHGADVRKGVKPKPKL